MIKLLLLLVAYMGQTRSQCSYESTYMYCTNMISYKENTTLTIENNNSSQMANVKAAYLRNISGKITDETFSLFPQIQSLDIQFSVVDEFLPKLALLDTLYITNNMKFPNLTEDMLKDCCKHFIILFIVNNTGMEIEEGALKHLENLTQLTISLQNITHLTKGLLQGIGNLTYLNLKQNRISIIDVDTFEDLSKLNYLDLSTNNFKIIETKTFDNLKVLESIELYDLKLDEFNPTIFSKVKEVKHIGLSTNLIKKKLELQALTKTFPKLETIGIQDRDKEDKDVAEFVKTCEFTGFYIRYWTTNNL